MPAGSTYTPIATTTLGSAAASYTFSSIPSTYTDLVLVVSAETTTASTYNGLNITFNSDTGSNYSYTNLYGSGSVAGSSRASSETSINILIGNADAGSHFSATINHIMNYANTTTYKTLLSRGNVAEAFTNARVGLWRSTAAITSITATAGAGNIAAGSTLTLYGIAAA